MSVLSKLAGTVTAGRALAYGAAACVALSTAAFFAGVHFGRGWERGKQAEVNVAALGQQISAFTESLDIAAQDNAKAQQSLAAVVQETINDLETKRRAADAAARSLDRALDARPDLRDVRVGADILRAWNAGNAGNDPAGGAGAAAPDPGDAAPASGVPTAPAGDGRQHPDPDAQPRQGVSAVPPMRGARRWLVAVAASARANRSGTHRASGGGAARSGWC